MRGIFSGFRGYPRRRRSPRLDGVVLLRALPRKAATLALAAAAGVLGATLLASPASAHTSEVFGVGKCDTQTGTWKVSWTVVNHFGLVETVSNVVFDPAVQGANLPGSVPAKETGRNGKDGSASVVITLPGSATAMNVSFKATWSDTFSENVRGTAKLDGHCVPPRSPSPSPSPSKSKSTAPPPPALVVTGPPTAALLGGGGFLVAGGAALLVLALRRRRRVTFVAD